MTTSFIVTAPGALTLTDGPEGHDLIASEGGYQPLLERDVVVRRLHPGAAASPRIYNRFVNEIKALASLHHHNFVRVYDAGVVDEVPFAILERLEGNTVQQRLEILNNRHSRLSLEEAVRIVRSVAEAVDHAHRQGVQVFDVTPENIVLTHDRRVVLTSLGQPLPDNPLRATPLTLAYTAPERLMDEEEEGNQHVYGLGVLLAHLVFGQPPFEGEAIEIISQKHQSNSLPALENPHISLHIPYSLATVIHRATARNLHDRYPSVESMLGPLREALSGPPYRIQSVTSRVSPKAAQPTSRITEIAGQPYYDHVSPIPPMQRVSLRVTDHPSDAREPVQHRQAKVKGAPSPTRPDHSDHAPAHHPHTDAQAAEPPVSAAYDPLTPGLDNPDLQPALPYTKLVPLPEHPNAEASSATSSVPAQPLVSVQHLVVLTVLCMMAVGAAIMFG